MNSRIKIISCYHTKKRRGHIIYKCPVCHKEFRVWLSQYVAGGGKHFCSPECFFKQRENNHDYMYNDKFIDKDNELRSYFLGLFVTDGHLSKHRVFSLALTDRQLIKDLAKRINYRRSIRKIVSGDPKHKSVYALELSGPIPIKLHRLGFPYGPKTGKEFIPNGISDKTFKHFLRGLIDGDGSFFIHHSNGNKWLNCKLVGSNGIFLKSILAILRTNKVVYGGGISCVYHPRPFYTLLFGHHDSIRVGKYIYDNPSILLNRKRKVWNSGLKVAVGIREMQENKLCNIKGCEQPSRTHGLCANHFASKYRLENKNKIRLSNKRWREKNRKCHAIMGT